MTEHSDKKWVRKLTMFEELLEVLHQNGLMITCYAMTLNSKCPLLECDVKQALLHLMRKVPSLNVCIRKRNESGMWFHKLDEENIDFKVLEKGNFEKEYDDMIYHHYDSFNGPLWCGRLIPLSSDAPCKMPEVKKEFSYQYYFLFGINHAVTDGFSNFKICDFILNLLNDVIAKKFISDEENLAYFSAGEQTFKLLQNIAIQLKQNPVEASEIAKQMKEAGELKSKFLETFPRLKHVQQQTLNIPSELTKEETSELLKKCKKEQTTVHSTFCTAANAAAVKMMVDAGRKESSFNLCHYHTINLRRYWDGEETDNALGGHIGKFVMVSEFPIDFKSKFWVLAREFAKNMKKLIDENMSLKELALTIPANAQEKQNSEDIAKFVLEMKPNESMMYGTTNMGNLTNIFPGEGEHVQATHIQRTTSTKDQLGSHVFHTFRGRLIYGYDYNSNYITKENAKLYVDTIFKLLRDSIKD